MSAFICRGVKHTEILIQDSTCGQCREQNTLINQFFNNDSSPTHERMILMSRFFKVNQQHTARLVESDSQSNDSYEPVLSSDSKTLMNQLERL